MHQSMAKAKSSLRISIPPLADANVNYLKSVHIPVQIINASSRSVMIESVSFRFQTDLQVAAADLTIEHECQGLVIQPGRMEYLTVKVVPHLVFRAYTNVFDVHVGYRRQERHRLSKRFVEAKPRGESSFLIIHAAPSIFGNIFISYKEPEDRGLATMFYNLAMAAGFAPYMAPTDMKPGSRIWRDKIPQAIKNSKAAFVIWTSKTALGKGVKREIKLCRANGIPDILLLEEGVAPPSEHKATDLEWTPFAIAQAAIVFANAIRSYREMQNA
jgi:hypothetical protein